MTLYTFADGIFIRISFIEKLYLESNLSKLSTRDRSLTID